MIRKKGNQVVRIIPAVIVGVVVPYVHTVLLLVGEGVVVGDGYTAGPGVGPTWGVAWVRDRVRVKVRVRIRVNQSACREGQKQREKFEKNRRWSILRSVYV